MEFRILGPLEVLSDGRALDVGGHKQSAVLALLPSGALRGHPDCPQFSAGDGRCW